MGYADSSAHLKSFFDGRGVDLMDNGGRRSCCLRPAREFSNVLITSDTKQVKSPNLSSEA